MINYSRFSFILVITLNQDETPILHNINLRSVCVKIMLPNYHYNFQTQKDERQKFLERDRKLLIERQTVKGVLVKANLFYDSYHKTKL